MKILVFSDTHGVTDRMKEILGRNFADTDLVIHLGDKITDLYDLTFEYNMMAFLYVTGNCDYYSGVMSAPYERSVTLEDKKFLMLHGHTKGVNQGIFGLLYDARNADADIVLYGHTHVANLTEKDGITFFNPGSLTLPRDGTNGTYGIIRINNGKAEFEIKELEN